jgi:hypothetical protein
LDFLRSLPFEWIYQDARPTSPAEQDLATFHRQAEVLVPEELPLDPVLRFLYVRTPAERETPQTLLRETGLDSVAQWAKLIYVDSRAEVFFKRWSFVVSTYLDTAEGTLLVRFNRSSQTPAPFTAKLTFRVPGTDRLSEETRNNCRLDWPESLQVPAAFRTAPFDFRIELDDCLAYANQFDPTKRDVLISAV